MQRRIEESKREQEGKKDVKGCVNLLKQEKTVGGEDPDLLLEKLADANRLVRKNIIQLTQLVGDFDPNKPASEDF